MSVESNCNILTLIIVSILILSVFGQEQKKKDENFCPQIHTVLCVKDILFGINKATKAIDDVALEIEQNILKRGPTQDTLNRYINHQMKRIRSNLPKSKYHNQFMQVNNINKHYLINLIKEENDAFSYLYNSIKTIQKISRISDNSIDESFKKILNILRKDILCNYRNILDVYLETYLPINGTDGIQISQNSKRIGSSFLYDTYSIIITRLLREWIKYTNHFIVNVENKAV